MPKEYDVLIAGGGVVGCAAALALANRSDLKIAVIESHPPSASDTHPSFDSRVIALAHASLQHMQNWQFDIGAVNGAPIKRIHVSDRKHSGQTVLSADDAHVDMLGKVVRLEALGLALYADVVQSKVDYFSPESISSVARTQDKVSVQTSKQALQAKLLVVAEGADSATRAMLGAQCEQSDYQQTAIISNVTTQLNHENCAFERFTKYGPIAFLPMAGVFDHQDKQQNDKLMSVVWTCSNAHVDELLAMPEHALLSKLQSLFGTRLGRLTSASPRVSYPLSLKQCHDFSGHRYICIGNAAQSLHPIAGQGFNLGVRDINDLLKAVSKDDDTGSFAVTQHYRELRAKDKHAVMQATDALVRGFSNHYLPMVLGRNTALCALNYISPLKQTFARFAMGQR